MSRPPGVEDLLRADAPRVLAAVVRRFRDFGDCEDAVQEALLAAATQWPVQGTPDNPVGWLIHVASRRMTDQLRSEHARQRREGLAAAAESPAADVAADHDEILALYELLERMTHNPMVALNRAIAAAMVDGPAAGLELLAALDEPFAGHHRLDAVRAHLLEMAGEPDAAIAAYQTAATRTTSLPEQHYLTTQAARLGQGHTQPDRSRPNGGSATEPSALESRGVDG
jgi:predicted RNA polymerase sigma factor